MGTLFPEPELFFCYCILLL